MSRSPIPPDCNLTRAFHEQFTSGPPIATLRGSRPLISPGDIRPMRDPRISILLLSFALTGLLVLPACEDEAARQRALLQEMVSDATQTLSEATLVVVDPSNEEQFARTRDQLSSLIGRLRSADTAKETGQEVAIDLLLADAGQKLAAMYLAELERTASEMRDDSAAARTHVSSLLQLNEFANAARAIDISDESAELHSARTSASEQLSALGEVLAQLDGPIAQLTAQNRKDAEQIRMLRRDAEQLVQWASELGPAEGFPQYEQAVEMQREAGAIETQIARREIDLVYQYEPEAATADTRAQQLQQFITAIDQARQKLSELVDSVSTEVSKTSQQLTALRGELDDRLREIDDAITGPIETAYQDGLSTADATLGGARSAARSSSAGNRGSFARLLEAQLLETQGRLHWAKARAVAEQINVLERVVEAGDVVGNTSTYQSQLRVARDIYKQTIELARQSYDASRAALPADNTSGISALHRSLDLAQRALTGDEISETAEETKQSPGAAPTEGTAGHGYQSPDDLLSALRTIDPARPQSSTVLLDAVHTTTPLQNQFLNAIYESIDASSRLVQAVQDSLGAQAAADLNEISAANSPDYDNAIIADLNDETATIQASAMAGMPQSLELIRVNDQWKVAFDSLAEQFTLPGMSMSDSIQYIRRLTQAIADIADRVESGEITDSQQLQTALQTATMTAAGGQ